MADFSAIAASIWDWAQQRNFMGFDPYDGLNSRLIGPIVSNWRPLRLAALQAVKRCPFNPRRMLLVDPGYNPKGLALFLSGSSFSKDLGNDNTSRTLQQKLLSLASNVDGSPALSEKRTIRDDITVDEVEEAGTLAWGYNFPWQGKAFYQPAWFPTVVCSSFVLDAFDDCHSSFYPLLTWKLADFIKDTLKVHEDSTGICFSYSPRDSSRVFNASLFAAKILARAASFEFAESGICHDMALKACNYVAARQREDGSWIYGEADHWQWVDNLHTGFILETLNFISRKLRTDKYDDVLRKGMEYYRDDLFEKDWTARYYSTCKYPLDPHSFAQAAITFLELSEFMDEASGIASGILEKAIECLWDEERQGFIFRRYRYMKDHTIFLRWSQGWMFKALCRYLKEI